METAVCRLCPFNCEIPENETGKCKVRGNVGGQVVLLTYGKVTTMVEGPIEQKPLYHFYPGMKVLSIGSSGCNMFCSYCQNFEISQTGSAPSQIVSPQEVVDKALSLGCGGIAFTYSEPFVWYEYVMNVAVAAKKQGLKTILKTNGYGEEKAFSEMLDWMDAVNIDIKGSARLYKEVAGIELDRDPRKWIIMRNLKEASKKCHIEISTIVIPPYWDDELDAILLACACQSFSRPDTPIHILKFIPDFKLRDTSAPTTEKLQRVAQIFGAYFKHVYIDYAGLPAITTCQCGEVLVERNGLAPVKNNLLRGKRCPKCGEIHNFEANP